MRLSVPHPPSPLPPLSPPAIPSTALNHLDEAEPTPGTPAPVFRRSEQEGSEESDDAACEDGANDLDAEGDDEIMQEVGGMLDYLTDLAMQLRV